VHHRLAVRCDFLWSLPLNRRQVKCVLWRIHWVIVERLVIRREFRISEKSVVFFTNLDNFENFFLNWVFLRSLAILLILVLHDFLAILEFLSVFILLLSIHLLILLLSERHAILSDELILVVIAHVLLLVVELLVISLLLLRGQLTEVYLHLLLHHHLMLVL
jgi:hypothetical protein